MMNKVVRELESCPRSLDPTDAAILEKSVRNAIADVAQTPAAGVSKTIGELWTPEVMAELRELWGDAPFERPSQPGQESAS